MKQLVLNIHTSDVIGLTQAHYYDCSCERCAFGPHTYSIDAGHLDSCPYCSDMAFYLENYERTLTDMTENHVWVFEPGTKFPDDKNDYNSDFVLKRSICVACSLPVEYSSKYLTKFCACERCMCCNELICSCFSCVHCDACMECESCSCVECESCSCWYTDDAAFKDNGYGWRICQDCYNQQQQENEGEKHHEASSI